jgi:hypothetical protein
MAVVMEKEKEKEKEEAKAARESARILAGSAKRA